MAYQKLLQPLKSYSLLFILFVISACSSVPKEKPVLEPQTEVEQVVTLEQKQQQLSQIQRWNIRGKVGLQSADDNGTASLDWQQLNNDYEINLSGPLGAGNIQISGDLNGNSTLVTAKNETYIASTAEDLLLDYAGLAMPISSLYYWVRGLPVPNVEADTQFDKDLNLSSLQQQGWTVQYQRYSLVSGINLPSRIDVYNQDYKIKIAINRWKI
ncbi:MAG: lipoprotein insertase outer membrane protein LolB [Gammaproteobacteria bacterium]